MYLNPDGVDETLVETVASLENVWNYFEIPVQHASDKILERMNRKSRIADIKELFTMIRRKIPDAVIRTTILVGFPGETEADFQELARFLEEEKPDLAGFFPYSSEEGTAAASFEGAVPKRITDSRIKALQKIQKRNTTDRLKKFKDIVCFIDKLNSDFGFIFEGRSFFQAPETDGRLYITDIGEIAQTIDHGPYQAKITKVAYPDIYVKLIQRVVPK